jgi:hypothetical protein
VGSVKSTIWEKWDTALIELVWHYIRCIVKKIRGSYCVNIIIVFNRPIKNERLRSKLYWINHNRLITFQWPRLAIVWNCVLLLQHLILIPFSVSILKITNESKWLLARMQLTFMFNSWSLCSYFECHLGPGIVKKAG